MPLRMQNPESGVTLRNGIDQQAQPNQIPNLFKGGPLLVDFLVDAVDMLRAPVHTRVDAESLEFPLDSCYHFVHIRFALGEFLRKQIGNILYSAG